MSPKNKTFMEIIGNKLTISEKEKENIINEFKDVLVNSKDISSFERTIIKKLLKICKQINVEIIKDKKLYIVLKVIMNDGSCAMHKKFNLIKTAEKKGLITSEQKNEITSKMNELIEGIHDSIILKDIKI